MHNQLCQKFKMSKAVIIQLVNKYKIKGTEHLVGLPKKSTPHY